MHTDARTLPAGSLIEGDLAIIGAGIAGISMAMEWIGAGKKVLLLEGGGLQYDPKMQDLFRGENVGLPYYPLQMARLHYFGGTSGHWGGLCSPLDPHDFEARPWVPHSGWPITRTDLDPYYKRAQPLLELTPHFDYDAASWQRRHPTLVPFAFDPAVVGTKMWQWSPQTKFGQTYRKPILDARDVHLYTNANVVELEANESATAVTGLRVRTLEGKEHRVRAKHYVLACCSIQNARLLLASNRQATAGLGNAHDLVGRHFMEHLEIPSGQLALLGKSAPRMPLYVPDMGKMVAAVFGELQPSAAQQRVQRMLNATVSLTVATPGKEAKSSFQLFTTEIVDDMRRMGEGDSVATAKAMRFFESEFAAPKDGQRLFNLKTRQEQAPNPLSRVTLSPRERDAMDMPRVRLDWRLTDLDRRSFRAFYKVLAPELGRSGVGRARVKSWVTAAGGWPESLSGGWHHMGTTRMHQDPKQGVVDANCRVHGVANLHVAGSSCFTTAGCANPTFTLTALTLRLSDRLKRVVT